MEDTHGCCCLFNLLTVLFQVGAKRFDPESAAARPAFKLSRCARLMKCTELQMLLKLFNPDSSCSCPGRCVWGLCCLILPTDAAKARSGR